MGFLTLGLGRVGLNLTVSVKSFLDSPGFISLLKQQLSVIQTQVTCACFLTVLAVLGIQNSHVFFCELSF